MSDLDKAVKDALPLAIKSSILRTAILREENNFPAPDKRSEEVKKFEMELRKHGGTSADALLASKMFGEKISYLTPVYSTIKPRFLSVLFPLKPLEYEGEVAPVSVKGMPFGTPIICVNSEKVSYRNGNIKYSSISLTTQFFVPADEAQVKQAVEALFAARPYATLGLYGYKMEGVHSIPSSEE